jgi:hypothetical protein
VVSRRFPIFGPFGWAIDRRFERIVGGLPPYSDFNFTSLHCWDVSDSVEVAVSYGNLVVRMLDYTTQVPYYSFLGTSRARDTAHELLERAHDDGLGDALRLVPEATALSIDDPSLARERDDANADYILCADRMATFRGNRLGGKRNFVNRFRSRYSPQTFPLDLTQVGVQTRLLDLFHRWSLSQSEESLRLNHELTALHRVMMAAKWLPTLRAYGTFVGDDLCGFSINERLGREYAMIHFEKADCAYAGLYPFLMQELAQRLVAEGCRWINYQQDLGLEGLRRAKQSYDPVARLHKWSLQRACDVPSSRENTIHQPNRLERLHPTALANATHAPSNGWVHAPLWGASLPPLFRPAARVDNELHSGRDSTLPESGLRRITRVNEPGAVRLVASGDTSA